MKTGSDKQKSIPSRAAATPRNTKKDNSQPPGGFEGHPEIPVPDYRQLAGADTLQRYASVVQRVKTVMSLSGLGPPADDDPIPVGRHIDSPDEGIAILQRLGHGDRSAFEDLGITAPPGYAMQTHEWGLGLDHDTGQYIIIRGGPGAVSFGSGILKNVTGISHTHPLPALGAKAGAGVGNATFMDMVDFASIGIDQVFGGFNSVLPSNSDLIANYTVGSRESEMLYTPYRLDDHGHFSDNDRDPYVSIRFGPTLATLMDGLPEIVEENTAISYLYAPLIIYRGDTEIWRGMMQAATDKRNTAWLKQEPIPGKATHRVENRHAVEAHNSKGKTEKKPASSILEMEPVDMGYDRIRDDARYEPMMPMEPNLRHSPPSKGKKGAKEKGGKEKKGGCFLTTACVEARGLPDDCHALMVLRAFRDDYMRALPDGTALLEEYYAIAPRIVDRIKARPDAPLVLDILYQRILVAVGYIEAGDPRQAMRHYMAVVGELKAEYL